MGHPVVHGAQFGARPASDPVHLGEVATARDTIDTRYDDLKSGRVEPIDAEEAFRRLREKSERRRSRG